SVDVDSSRSERSCPCSRSCSPVTFVPRSSGRLDSLPRRSRSRCSASPGKESQEPRQVRTVLRSGKDRVEMTESEGLLGAAEVVRELLLDDRLHDPRTGERE